MLVNKYPKITVVTPSFNQGTFLERTILSVLNQNYPNLEYIICDGGSSDNSVEIIKKYEDRLFWWCSEKDKGQTDAINKGFRKATGDVCCWINSDDVLIPGALMAVGSFFITHPETDFLNGLTVEIDKEDRILKFTHIIMSKFFFRHGCYNISQQGMFWRRSLFNIIGYLDESFHAKMDVEWLIRNYEKRSKIRLVNLYLGAIRIYGETKTAIGGNIWLEDSKKIHARYNGAYSPVKMTPLWFFYVLYKFVRGCYIKNWIMKLRYGGKEYTSLNP